MTQPLHTTSSNTNMQTFGSSGAFGSSVSTGGWSSLSAKRTTSFSSIHNEVSQYISYSPIQTYSVMATTDASDSSTGRGDNPGGNSVGDASVPAGDMLLPLLLMAAAYIVVKLFRNHKTSQIL